MTLEEKRLILREKVAASKQRMAPQQAEDGLVTEPPTADGQHSSRGALGFVKQHPIAFFVGALAVGLVVGSRGRKPAKPARKPSIVGSLLIEAAIGYGLKMIDKGRANAEKTKQVP